MVEAGQGYEKSLVNGEESKKETTLGSDVFESTEEYKNLREVKIRLEDVQNFIKSKNVTEDIDGEGEDKDNIKADQDYHGFHPYSHSCYRYPLCHRYHPRTRARIPNTIHQGGGCYTTGL